MRYRGCNFTLNQEGTFEFDGVSPGTSHQTPPLMFYLYVDEIDQTLEQALNLGCQILQPARVEFWGDRKARLKDPFGYIWEIAAKVEPA